MLIVEDDRDVRSYLAHELGNAYTILQAENGAEGLEMAIQQLPDLIISDVAMPVMDGLALCRSSKTNEATCQIPIILLTAMTSKEQQMEGLEMGADAYIPKPFNLDHLQTRIEKLLELRNKLRRKYEGKLDVAQSAFSEVQNQNEKFLAKMDAYLMEHLADADLNIDQLSRDLGVSRSQLHRKMNTLINQTPTEYIKAFKMRHAVYLLVEKQMGIAEVAYALGFLTHSHFSSTFKSFFGMTPKTYVKIHEKQL